MEFNYLTSERTGGSQYSSKMREFSEWIGDHSLVDYVVKPPGNADSFKIRQVPSLHRLDEIVPECGSASAPEDYVGSLAIVT